MKGFSMLILSRREGELFDFGCSVARLTHQELHGDAPGDWHEQEFVNAMRQDGVIPPEKSEND
ncbi:MAG: hypothetical protein M0P55_15370, partial [Clostridiales bacterium]|nr:hypothetical protein [Clostridiales bacterium]